MLGDKRQSLESSNNNISLARQQSSGTNVLYMLQYTVVVVWCLLTVVFADRLVS